MCPSFIPWTNHLGAYVPQCFSVGPGQERPTLSTVITNLGQHPSVAFSSFPAPYSDSEITSQGKLPALKSLSKAFLSGEGLRLSQLHFHRQLLLDWRFS